MRSGQNPINDATTGAIASYNSCYKVNVSEVAPGQPYVFGLKHLTELFQYTVSLVQDLLFVDLVADNPLDYPKYLATDWEVYIGNDPVWYNNPKCPGDPQLKSTFDDVYE